MKKKRRLPSYLRTFGYVIIIFSAIALPSAGGDSRSLVIKSAILGLVLIVAGISLGIYFSRKNSSDK